MDDLIKDLDEKFTGNKMEFDLGQTKMRRWDLHQWEYYGATFGFELTLKDNVFKFKQYLESGYVPGKTIIETTDLNAIREISECFSPTNDSYKTDRK